MEACPSRAADSESHRRPPSFHPSPGRPPAGQPPGLQQGLQQGLPQGLQQGLQQGLWNRWRPGSPPEHSLEQGVSCVNILSKQPFGLRALRKMINIISLTSSKFGVYKAILARTSCRLVGPDGNTALTFNIDTANEQHGCAGLSHFSGVL